MAREKNAAAVALTAAAALASTTPPPPDVESEEMERVEGAAPDPGALVAKIAELNTRVGELEHQLTEERRRSAEIETALIEARSDLRAQRANFDRAWSEREAQLAALSPERVVPPARVDALPPGAPVRGRVIRARCMVMCRGADGAPITIPAGGEVPAGADLTGVSPEALTEESAR